MVKEALKKIYIYCIYIYSQIWEEHSEQLGAPISLLFLVHVHRMLKKDAIS